MRQWTLKGTNIRQFDGPSLNPGEKIEVVEKCAYDKLQADLNSYKDQLEWSLRNEEKQKQYYFDNQKEIRKLKAENWVLKDNSLRTYDGLAQRADRADKLEEKLQNILTALKEGHWVSDILAKYGDQE